jgi:hypothetical protein
MPYPTEPLPSSVSIGALQAAEAVERLRRRTIYTASGLDITDPSSHNSLGITLSTTHVVVLAVRRKAGSTTAVRPVDCVVHSESANGAQWLLLHVPAALVPAALSWTDLFAGAPAEWARADAGGVAVALTPVLTTMDCLSAGSTAGVGEYRSFDLSDAQPIGAGDALVVVAARRGAADSLATASIRVELADE